MIRRIIWSWLALMEGSADFIISGDHHLIDIKNYQGIKIVNPAKFLDIMERE